MSAEPRDDPTPNDPTPADAPRPTPLAWALSHATVLLALAGVSAYALGRVCYIAFYSAFGISPDEVGIDQARSVETAGLLLVAGGIVAAAFWLNDLTNERRGIRWRALGMVALWAYILPVVRYSSLGDSWVITLTALLVNVLGFFILEVAVAVLTGRRATGLRWHHDGHAQATSRQT